MSQFDCINRFVKYADRIYLNCAKYKDAMDFLRLHLDVEHDIIKNEEAYLDSDAVNHCYNVVVFAEYLYSQLESGPKINKWLEQYSEIME